MILSVDAETTFDKIQYHFLIKALKKVRKEGSHLEIIKAIYKRPTTEIILNGEKVTAFPLISEHDKEVHSHHCYSIWCWKS